MHVRFAFTLLLTCGALLAGDPAPRFRCAGGTLTALAAGAEGRMDLTGADALRLRLRSAAFEVPYGKINLLEYGQKVDRRIAEAVLISPLMLLAKKRQHFLTVGFTDPEGRQQALVFRLEKGEVRGVLASLEAKTGRKVEFQDENARRAGKG